MLSVRYHSDFLLLFFSLLLLFCFLGGVLLCKFHCNLSTFLLKHPVQMIPEQMHSSFRVVSERCIEMMASRGDRRTYVFICGT